MKQSLISSILLGMLVTGCEKPPNSNPPAYILESSAIRRGCDGLVMFVTLADEDGRLTTASGTFEYEIIETVRKTKYKAGPDYDYMAEVLLFRDRINVSPESFRKRTIKLGGMEANIIFLSTDRITYSRFFQRPSQYSGTIRSVFTTKDGRKLKGKGKIIF